MTEGRGGALIPLHPLSLGDILDGGFRILRATARDVMLLTGLILGPLNIVQAFVTRFDANELLTPTGELALGSATIVAIAFTLLATFFVTPLVSGAITWHVIEADRGAMPSWQSSLRHAASRYGRLLGASLLTLLIGLGGAIVIAIPAGALATVFLPLGILIGAVGFIVLAAILIPLLYVVVPAIIVEDIGPVAAVRRSAELIRPDFWRVLGIVIVTGILVGILGSALGFGFQLVSFVAGPFGWVLIAIGSILASLVTTPLIAAIVLLLYVDARIRREGYDIQVLTAPGR